MSTARSYDSDVFNNYCEGNRISSGDSLRVLGFHFSSESNVRKHLKITRTLRHFKKGFKPTGLLKVYTAMLRPVAEYCMNVYASVITKEDSAKNWREFNLKL